MGKQMLISISREFGSEGHTIARKVAADLGITLYDRNILEAIAEEKETKVEKLEQFDEVPRNMMLTRSVGEHTSSMEDHLVNMQFEFLQRKADSGESFVVVGRCAETVLKGRDGLIKIFILGDKEEKHQHIKEYFHISDGEATAKIIRHDARRKLYHNRYSEFKWGDSRGYDLCINSSRLGVDKTVKIIEEYIKERM